MKQVRIAVLACGVLTMLAAVRPVATQASMAVANQDALPAAKDILAKHVAASGGADAFKAIKSMRAKGTFEMPAQQLTGTFEALSARPAFSRVTVELGAIGRVDKGTDGKIAWEMNPMTGPSLATGKALNDELSEAQFDGQWFAPETIKEATTLAKTTFDGKPAYKVKVVSTFGVERTLYFDIETSLLRGAEMTMESSMGAMAMSGTMRDYKKFGALMQPTTISQSSMGIEQILHVESYEYDMVPMSAFDLPPAIKALIK
jgi:hypothetical protein